MDKGDSITFERTYIETVTITCQNIKDPNKLMEFVSMKCDITTKKSDSRPWIYLKDTKTLKTIGGIRLNKNSIGTFYIDTHLDTPLSNSSFGIISKKVNNFYSNRIIVNDIYALDRVTDLIKELHEQNKLYCGKRT